MHRVLATECWPLAHTSWAGSVRPRHRLDALGNAALGLERPLHLAAPSASRALCRMPVVNLRECPMVFSEQDVNLRCPMCDEAIG
jgi:hypothetical protein